MSRSAIRPGATGRVVDSVSGQPLAGAEVVLEGPLRWDKGVYAASSYTGNAHTVTDKDGKFTIDPLMGFGYRAYTIQSANGVLVTTSRVNVQMIGYLSQHVLFSTDVTSDVGTIQLKHR